MAELFLNRDQNCQTDWYPLFVEPFPQGEGQKRLGKHRTAQESAERHPKEDTHMGHYARNGKWYPGAKESSWDVIVRQTTGGHFARNGKWYPGPKESREELFARRAREALRRGRW